MSEMAQTEKRKKLLSITPSAVNKLEQIANKLGLSESAVVEILIRKYGDKLLEEMKA